MTTLVNNLYFDYAYIDASNYKIFGSVTLVGDLPDAAQKRCIECLEENEFFIAEQVGIPPLHNAFKENYVFPTCDDHPWHAFERFREEPEDGDCNNTQIHASVLLSSLLLAKDAWKPELSKFDNGY